MLIRISEINSVTVSDIILGHYCVPRVIDGVSAMRVWEKSEIAFSLCLNVVNASGDGNSSGSLSRKHFPNRFDTRFVPDASNAFSAPLNRSITNPQTHARPSLLRHRLLGTTSASVGALSRRSRPER